MNVQSCILHSIYGTKRDVTENETWNGAFGQCVGGGWRSPPSQASCKKGEFQRTLGQPHTKIKLLTKLVCCNATIELAK